MCSALESSLGEGVSEAVEGALFLGWPNSFESRREHCWVELLLEQDGWRHDPRARVWEDETVREAMVLVGAPMAHEGDHLGDQVDVSSLSVLGCSEMTAGVAAADANDGLLEIDVAPPEGDQFSLSHASLER